MYTKRPKWKPTLWWWVGAGVVCGAPGPCEGGNRRGTSGLTRHQNAQSFSKSSTIEYLNFSFVKYILWDTFGSTFVPSHAWFKTQCPLVNSVRLLILFFCGVSLFLIVLYSIPAIGTLNSLSWLENMKSMHSCENIFLEFFQMSI